MCEFKNLYMKCPKCQSELYTVYVYKGKKKGGKSGLSPIDYTYCEKCDKFYKIRLEIKP